MNSRSWITVGFLLTVLALAGQLASSLTQAEEKPAPAGKLSPADARAGEKAIRSAAQQFSAAFARGDVEALLAFWTPDGEYVTEAGRAYRGKGQLRVLLKKALTDNKGIKHSISIESIRFLKPDVAQEEGTVTLSSTDGARQQTPYVALWVQHGGKWLIASVRDVPRAIEDDRPASYHRLRQLSWLVGEWQEKNGETQLACTWSAGQAFLLLRWTVKQADGGVLQIGQRIGWDPINQRLRSWVFDATGGYGEGIWTREGNTWVVQGEGVYPDGKVATSVTRWKFVDRTSFQWSATSRTVDEMPLPDVEATFVRKSSKGTGR